ncbi:hypothetical protein CO2235_U590038 [Cupriavidus oxalaticus]|uniref:Uncharacterized protein n=1 Tax=Cupriavidus oxalaticus TaxID=96344 RepID=A0A375FR21_9BURK|nr:hypothetical protein CO2235_U590038 [Cupriavidus oxalaticus]
MATGASAGVAGANAYNEAGDHDFAPASLDVGNCRHAKQAGDNRDTDEAGKEGKAPGHVMAWQAQQAADDAADACDSAIEQHQHGCRSANEDASCHGLPRREVGKVNQHVASSFLAQN